MTTDLDRRRLRDGAEASAAGDLPDDASLERLKARRDQLSDAIRAMQSLDDLGTHEANDAALEQMRALEEQEMRVVARIAELAPAKEPAAQAAVLSDAIRVAPKQLESNAGSVKAEIRALSDCDPKWCAVGKWSLNGDYEAIQRDCPANAARIDELLRWLDRYAPDPIDEATMRLAQAAALAAGASEKAARVAETSGAEA